MVLQVLRRDVPARTRQVENVLVGIWDRGITWLGKGILKKVTTQNVVSALPCATTDNSGILKLLEAQQIQNLLAKQQQQLDKLVSKNNTLDLCSAQ